MIVVERSFAVTTAPAAVLDYLRDFANTQHWDPTVRSTVRADAGPPGLGATWRQVSRVFALTVELTYTLVTVDATGLVFLGRNEGATRTDAIRIRPDGGGTEVSYRVEVELHGLAKLATPIIAAEFEKIGTESRTRLVDALNTLAVPGAAGVTTEITIPAPETATAPLRGQEAQA